MARPPAEPGLNASKPSIGAALLDPAGLPPTSKTPAGVTGPASCQPMPAVHAIGPPSARAWPAASDWRAATGSKAALPLFASRLLADPVPPGEAVALLSRPLRNSPAPAELVFRSLSTGTGTETTIPPAASASLAAAQVPPTTCELLILPTLSIHPPRPGRTEGEGSGVSTAVVVAVTDDARRLGAAAFHGTPPWREGGLAPQFSGTGIGWRTLLCCSNASRTRCGPAMPLRPAAAEAEGSFFRLSGLFNSVWKKATSSGGAGPGTGASQPSSSACKESAMNPQPVLPPGLS